MTTVADVVLSRLKGTKFEVGSSEEDFMFAAFCVANMELSYSQRLQDLWVLYEIGKDTGGTFLDFGAGNGRDSSNSFILHRKFGWTGLLIEPNDDYADNLDHHVSTGVTWVTGVAVGPEDSKGRVDFVVSSDPSISTLHYTSDLEGGLQRLFPSEIRQVEMWSLQKTLNLYFKDRPVTYLSIDTEGSEYDILSSYFANPEAKKFECITVEHNYNHEARQKIRFLLVSQGYVNRFPEYSGHDDFYILRSKLKHHR